MNKEKIIYFFLDIINKALPFLVIPFLSSKVTLTDYGNIEIFVSTYIFLGFFIGFGFEGWLSANYYKLNLNKINNTIKSYIFFAVSSALILFIIVYFYNKLLSAAVFIAYINALLFLTTTLLRLDGKFIYAGLLLILNSIANVSFLYLLFEFYDASYKSRVYSLIITSLITFIAIIILMRLFHKKIFSSHIILKDFYPVIFFCLPLCISMLSSWLKGNIDKFYINAFLSPSELAIYGLAFQISSVINVLTVTINKIYQPSFFKSLTNLISPKKSISHIILLLILLSLLYYIFISLLFPVFFDSRYLLATSFIPWLIISFAMSAIVMLLNNYFLYYSLSKLIMYQVIFTSIIHSIISITLLKSFNLNGVILSQIISSFLSLIITLYFLRKMKKNV